MNKLDKKTLDVSRGFTYTYYTSPAKGGCQTVLLVHGFPSITEEWSEVISDHLLPNGYGVLVIDCLGYAGSSKPTDLNAYNLQYIAQDIKEIFDKESLDKVVSLGHDWVSISCPLKPTSHFYLQDMNFA
jgi:soluble epoxide hydrolase/lipid-phosphate phosphatase